MSLIDKYLQYVSDVRRYSARTREIYSDILFGFAAHGCEDPSDEALLSALTMNGVREYEVWLLDQKGLSPKTVNLHLSVLSGFCRFLARDGRLETNPVKLVKRPKEGKRLPVTFAKDFMDRYFGLTAAYSAPDTVPMVVGHDKGSLDFWTKRRDRLVIRMLYDTGLRRSELISLDISSIDFGRSVLRVIGKGDKMREIPLIASLCDEISLYLQTTVAMLGRDRLPAEPLFVTERGNRLYPMAVERIVTSGMSLTGVTGRKSPHVLRHTLATELLDEGAELDSIKELLGHSSLAATQVYTHAGIEQLRKTYNNAHPRAKRGD